jgi:hypothetical protein
MANENVALHLETLTLNSDEVALVEEMIQTLAYYETRNKLKAAYYDGRHKVEQLGIAIPPSLEGIRTVVGWPTIAVDALDERLDWHGWATVDGDDFGLGDIYRANDLDVESGLGHLDTLMYGTGFITVGPGDLSEGEPDVLITVESARYMTGIWNPRTRRLDAALKVMESDGGNVNEVMLYTRTERIWAVNVQGIWNVVDRVDHGGSGRVPVVQLTNRPRASRTGGKSEITPAVRYYTDHAVRTWLNMEVNREFYSSPQRYVLGADASVFQDEDGNMTPAWESYIGRYLALPSQPKNPEMEPDGTEMPDDFVTPTVGQFQASSPAPMLQEIQGLSQAMAAETGMPAHYLGFISDNPASADAIRAGESRLIKRAEKRIAMFSKSWREVGRLALLVRDGALPDNINDLDVEWADPATPTRSAAADEAVKLSSGDDPIIPRNSVVLYKRLNLSPQEQRQLESDKRKASASQRIADIAAATKALGASAQTAPESPVTEE